MSERYDYLFKFIVIGDSNTGKSCILHRFIEKKCKKIIQPTKIHLIIYLFIWLFFYSQGRFVAHHRRGVREQDHRGRREEDQAPDLGHCGPGQVPLRDPQLLPRRCRGPPCLRHHKQRLLQPHRDVAQRCPHARQRWCLPHPRW